jgi:hypothetical protein
LVGAVGGCHDSGLSVIHGKLHAAGFPDESSDMVSVRYLIEHLPDTIHGRGRLLYVWPARLTGLGDEIVAIFEKNN